MRYEFGEVGSFGLSKKKHFNILKWSYIKWVKMKI